MATLHSSVMDPYANDSNDKPAGHRGFVTVDLDDAFSEGGDDAGFQFSPEAIREEMAKHMPPIEATWEPPSPAAHLENLSVSTLDMDNDVHRNTLESAPQSPSATSPELPDHFSQISLSRSNSGQEREDNTSPTQPQEYEDMYQDKITSYPVVIDASNGAIEHTPSVPPSLPHSFYLASPARSSIETPLDSALSIKSLPNPEREVRVGDPEPSSSGPVASTRLSESHPPSPKTNGIDIPPVVPAGAGAGAAAATTSSVMSKEPIHSKPSGHRHTRSTGPSAFEKVRSKTRPVFLPPKPRHEDNKHLADWHHMMEQSRHIAEKKTKAQQERRLAREKQIEDSIHIWEKQILPDWRVVNKNPALRKVWWRGIPPKYRADMWEKAAGNALALNKDNYRTCLSRARRALSSNVFPKEPLDAIEKDILSTLPSLHLFHPETGPMYTELKEMLCAWVVARSDEGLSYRHGAAKLAAMLLINMPVQKAFVVMRNLLERHCLRSFYGGESTKDDVEAYYRIFDTLLADGMPKIYFNFKQHQVSPSLYLGEWLVPLFLDHLPFEACARIWDVIILEGDSFLYRVALAILAVLEPRLFFPDRRELLELLRGENKAALEVAKRERRPLDGGKYEIYGLDDESVWERIDGMEDWWKESTWTRLLRRELPDI